MNSLRKKIVVSLNIIKIVHNNIVHKHKFSLNYGCKFKYYPHQSLKYPNFRTYYTHSHKSVKSKLFLDKH